MQIVGSRGRIEVETLPNAPRDRSCRLLIDDGSDLAGAGIRSEPGLRDQYTLQAEANAVAQQAA